MSDKKDKVKPATVLRGTREATGVIRGRDVVMRLTGKVDPEVLAVLAQIAEVNHGNVLHLASIAQMLDQMTDMLQAFTNVAQNMKDRTDQMARAMEGEVEGAPTDVEDTKH